MISRLRASVLVAVTCVLAVSCGGSDSSGPSDVTLGVQGAAVTSTIADTPVADSIGGTVPATPSDSAVASTERATPRDETPLPAGAYRTDLVVGPMVPIDFDLPVADLYTLVEEGILAVMPDETGNTALVTVLAVDNTLAFTTPTVAFENLADQAYFASITEPAPDDLLTWFAARPGVTAGPVVDTIVAGHPARSMTYSIGPFDGAAPCGAGDQLCAATLFAPITGLGQVYLVGDSGTLSELRVGGHRFSVDVNDLPDAAAIADSLVLEVVPPSTAPPDAEPVPFTGPHEQGTTYYSERSSGGLYVLDGFEGISTADSFLRTSQLRLESDSTVCMIITDIAEAEWRGVPAADPVPLVSSPIPDDIITALTALDGVSVVAAPFEIDLGGVVGTAVDVTAVDGEIAILNRALGVTPGVTTRFVRFPRPDDEEFDLISVVLGSPCEPVLETIRPLPSGRD